MKLHRVFPLCLAVLMAWHVAKADVQVSAVFGDNMVLQRDLPVPVWGVASPGEHVTVLFKNQRLKTTADASSNWRVELQPMHASDTSEAMTIQGERHTRILHNILVGEVWLVSGQSNMEFPMTGFPGYGVHLPESIQNRLNADLFHPNCGRIRLLHRTLDPNLPSGKTDGWTRCDSNTLASFSAVGYYFAKEISEKVNVPVGIMEAAVGGTRIEPWIPLTIKSGADLAKTARDPADTGSLYNKLIGPLAPYAIRGVLWYQGEANVLALGADTYKEKMRDLIQGWRAAWNRQDLPFEYALIAPMRYTLVTSTAVHLTEESLPEFWDQQIRALDIPYTSIISTNDLVQITNLEHGQPVNPYIMDLIHPGDKWDVGHRFALVALAKQYGVTGTIFSGPTLQSVASSGACVYVNFENIADGLSSRDSKPLTTFELAGSDKKFWPASGSILGTSVILTSPHVANPTEVRFGWNEVAQPNLINRAGLPALPFSHPLSESERHSSSISTCASHI